MSYYISFIFVCLLFLIEVSSLIPPKFQWKVLDYAWNSKAKEDAITSSMYIAKNNMPAGLARWRDKLFITIPRWKKGVPSSLNFVYLNGSQNEPLNPYPNWRDGCLTARGIPSNRTVVSTFKVHVDKCDRLWVVDNGVTEMATNVKQLAPPSILVFDLRTDQLLLKHVFNEDVLRDSSVLTSVVVEELSKDCSGPTFAYVTDMGSNAIIVYDVEDDEAWRVENHYFHFDPHAGEYKVGGIEFYWSDGVSSAALSSRKKDGFSDLYLHPTSSTKQFKMSTRLLRDRNTPEEDIFNGVEIVGDRGLKSQSTACDIDQKNNVLYNTQVCKNGISCWNINKPFTPENTPLVFSDCVLMEFPNDIKVDSENNVWILSNRQSRFLYDAMNYDDVNFRVLTAPSSMLTQGTACSKLSNFARIGSLLKFQ